MFRVSLLAILCLGGTLLTAQEVGHRCADGCSSSPSYSPTPGELAADARERRQEQQWNKDHKHWVNAKQAVERANAAAKRGQYSSAVEILNLALNDANGYSELTTWIHHSLASVYNEWATAADTQKDYLNSIHLFQQALANWDIAGIRGNLAAEQNDYAVFAYRNRQWQTAIDYIQQAMATSPNTPLFQNNHKTFLEGAADYQAKVERQKQQEFSATKNREGMRTAVRQLSSDIAVPLKPFPSADIDFLSAGSTQAAATNCGSSAMQQLNCAAKTSDRAVNAEKGETSEAIAQSPFDRNSGIGPPPEKMRTNAMALGRFHELQSRQLELQTRQREFSSRLETLRKQRGEGGSPSTEESEIKSKLLQTETDISTTRRALIDLSVPFEDDPPTPGKSK